MTRGRRSSGTSLWEERPPFYRRKRRRREAAPGAEGNAGDETNRQQPKGCTVRIRTPLSQKSFQLPCDLSYTRSAWQKFRHRLGSFPQLATRRDEALRGETAGGGGAPMDVPLVLMLIQVGKEPPL